MKNTSGQVAIRYIVNDIAASVKFYRDLLGFKVEMDTGTGFAKLSHGNLQLMLNIPNAGGAGQAMPDGANPAPGGWNRLMFETDDLDADVKQLKDMKAKFRNDIVNGIGGRQILLQDPSGNLIELFEPKK